MTFEPRFSRGAPIRFVRLRWWWAKLWRTRDYRYVKNDAQLPDLDGIPANRGGNRMDTWGDVG